MTDIDPGHHSEIFHPLRTIVDTGGVRPLVEDAAKLGLDAHSAPQALPTDVAQASRDLRDASEKAFASNVDVHLAKEPQLDRAQEVVNSNQQWIRGEQALLREERYSLETERSRLDSRQNEFAESFRKGEMSREAFDTHTREVLVDRQNLDARFVAHDIQQQEVDGKQAAADKVQSNIDSWRTATRNEAERSGYSRAAAQHRDETKLNAEIRKVHEKQANEDSKEARHNSAELRKLDGHLQRTSEAPREQRANQRYQTSSDSGHQSRETGQDKQHNRQQEPPPKPPAQQPSH
jgi:hypothetical protein